MDDLTALANKFKDLIQIEEENSDNFTLEDHMWIEAADAFMTKNNLLIVPLQIPILFIEEYYTEKGKLMVRK